MPLKSPRRARPPPRGEGGEGGRGGERRPEAQHFNSISGLVVEYIVAIDVTRVRFPADALLMPLYFTGGDEKRRRRACL